LYKFHATAVQVNSQFSPADSQSLTTVVVKHFHLLIRKQAGWTVGQNIRLDYRWGDGKVETMRKYAAELVALLPVTGDDPGCVKTFWSE
jgi:hypothetical protein